MTDEQKKYLEKIKKLLNLAKSPNPNEAAVALSRAQAMMRKHGFEIGDVMLSEVGSTTTLVDKLNPPGWVLKLLKAVDDAFGVTHVLTEEYDHASWKRRGAVMFIGIMPNDEIASYCFNVLYRQLMTDRKVFIAGLHKNCKKATKTNRADWYCLGWISEVSSKVQPLVVPTEQKGLIKSWKDKNLNITTYQARQAKDDKRAIDAYLNGKSDGAGVSIHAGVSSENREASLVYYE